MDGTGRTSRERRRRMLGLAVPATLTLLAEPLLGVVDTAIAGRIGTVELGALGFAVSILGVVTWVFNFLVFGTTTTVARSLGAGERYEAGRGLAHAGIVAIGLGLTAGVILGVGAPLLVGGIGAVDALVEPTVTYLRVRAIGIPFMLLGFVGHGAFRGAGDLRRPLLVVIIANLVNLGLNIFLVFGLGWGLAGVAASTVAAEIIIAVWLGLMIPGRLNLVLGGHGLPDRSQVQALFVVSRDLFLRTAGLVGGIAAITAAAARTDPITAAGHQVIWQVYLLVSFLLDGLAVSAQTMIGNAIGSRDLTEVRDTARDGLRWSVWAGVIIGAVLLLGRVPIVSVFTPDPDVVAVTALAWWLPSIAMVLHTLVFVLDGILMGASDYAFIRRWTLLGGVVGGVMAQVGVGLGGGLLWLWVSYEVVMLLRGIPLLIRVRGDRWLPLHG
ncbi:MAG: MATE family efflux transporter [Acidimicrobiia bacterium]|nr:MATE family efflux transporter [Acidimicrobiia bacterium]